MRTANHGDPEGMSAQPKATASTALARLDEPASAMVARGDWGPEHMRIVRESFAYGASDAEFAVLWAGAKARRLDPVRKQVYFVRRWDSEREAYVWASQTSIRRVSNRSQTTRTNTTAKTSHSTSMTTKATSSSLASVSIARASRGHSSASRGGKSTSRRTRRAPSSACGPSART